MLTRSVAEDRHRHDLDPGGPRRLDRGNDRRVVGAGSTGAEEVHDGEALGGGHGIKHEWSLGIASRHDP